jgi:hypothetical protein
MADRVALGDLVGAGPGLAVEVDDDRIARILAAAGLDDDGEAARTADVLRQVLSDLADEPLAVRLGGWRVDVSATALRAGVGASLMVAAIEAVGIDSVPVVVLTAVLPFLVDIEHIEVSPADRIVLAALKTNLASPQNRRALWDALPPDLQHELSFLEFADLLDRLSQANLIQAVDDERYGLPAKHGIFRGRFGPRSHGKHAKNPRQLRSS